MKLATLSDLKTAYDNRQQAQAKYTAAYEKSSDDADCEAERVEYVKACRKALLVSIRLKKSV